MARVSTGWVVAGACAVTVGLLGVSFLVDQRQNPIPEWGRRRLEGFSRESATASLELLKEWCTWMAGIQTAALAGIGLLTRERALSRTARSFAAAAFALLGLALFASASILAALPSLALRVGNCSVAETAICYYFYDHPLLPGYPVRFGLLVFWQHWLWAFGLLCFGVFTVSAVLSPPNPAPAHQPGQLW